MVAWNWKESVRLGLITGGVIFYLNVLGIPLQAGSAAVWIFAVVVALMAFLLLRDRRGQPVRRGREALLTGLMMGVIAGILLALTTLFFARLQADGVQVQRVFAQVLPEHTGALTNLSKAEVQQGANISGALLRLALILSASGALGGALTRLVTAERQARRAQTDRSAARRRLVFVLPFLFYGLFLLIRLDGVKIAGSNENIVGLVLLFLFMGAALFGLRRIQTRREQFIFGGLWLLLLLIMPNLTDLFQNAVLGKVLIFAAIGLGLNIVIGYAGMLHLGFAAFFAVGAYAYGFLASPTSFFIESGQFGGLDFWTALPAAILLTILVGILLGIPILRTRGDYLAIITLGFAEIIRLLLVNLRDYTGGPGGILNLPPPTLLGESLGNPRGIFYLALVMAAIVIFMSVRLRDSRLGRAWVAMREDEDVAQVMGINPIYMKLLAFAIGAAFAGAAGMLYGSRQVNIFPDNFTLLISIDLLALVIIGGLGSIEGVLLGAIVLEGLPEILRGVDEYRIVAFGALLVVMMIVRPQGLLPSAQRELELKMEDRTQDAWLKMAGAQATQDEEEKPDAPNAENGP